MGAGEESGGSSPLICTDDTDRKNLPRICTDERGSEFKLQVLLMCDNPAPETKTMHIDYTISEADYASAQKLAIKRMKPLQYRLTLEWLPAFGLLLLGFLFYTGYRQGFSTSLAPGFFVSIFFLKLWVDSILCWWMRRAR